MFHGPADDTEFHERLLGISDRLREAVRRAASVEPDCEATGACSYHHLDEPDTNVARCVACGSWTTNHRKPDRVAGIPWGSPVRGVYLCDQCQEAVESGEMPADRFRGLPFEGP